MKKKILLSPLTIIIFIAILGVGAAGAAIFLRGSGNTEIVMPNPQKGLLGEGEDVDTAFGSSFWDIANAVTPPAGVYSPPPGLPPAAKYYYLGQWEWFTENPDFSYWRCPDGDCVGLVDLRIESQYGKAGGAPEGYGFFVYDKPKTIPNSIYLGDNLNGTLQNKDPAEKALGVKIDSNTPLGLLWEMLTDKADPTGATAVKPLMPDKDLNLELYLGGKVKSEKFDRAKHAFVLDVIRNDYRRLRQEDKDRNSDHYKRVLDAWEEKYKINYKEFIPQDLPDEGKLPHSTTITESFNKADADTLGPDLTWTETKNDWDVVSNTAVVTLLNSNTHARAQSDLSKADHYSQVLVVTLNDPPAVNGRLNIVGSAVRFNSSADSFYAGGIRRAYSSGYSSNDEIYRVTTGTYVRIAGAITDTSWSIPATVRTDANGSVIILYVNGAEKLRVTDTNFTGQVRTGIRGTISTGGAANDVAVDNFQAGDESDLYFENVDIEGIDLN